MCCCRGSMCKHLCLLRGEGKAHGALAVGKPTGLPLTHLSDRHFTRILCPKCSRGGSGQLQRSTASSCKGDGSLWDVSLREVLGCLAQDQLTPSSSSPCPKPDGTGVNDLLPSVAVCWSPAPNAFSPSHSAVIPASTI